jgi:hypothetical protein
VPSLEAFLPMVAPIAVSGGTVSRLNPFANLLFVRPDYFLNT